MPQHRIFFGYTSEKAASLEIEASASILLEENFPTLSINAEALLDSGLILELNLSLTISAASSVTRTYSTDYLQNLTISSSASATLLAGFELLNTLDINGIADFVLLPGTGYFEELTYEADAVAIADYTIALGDVLIIEAEADFVIEEVLEPGGLLTIAAIGSVSAETLQDYDINLPIDAIAIFYPENIFDFVTSQGDASASLTSAYQYIAGSPFTANIAATVSAEVTGIYNKTITDVISFTETINVSRPIITEIESLTFTDSVTVQKIVTINLVESITFTDEAYRILPIIDSISFTDSAIAIKVISRTVTNVLNLTDVLFRNITVNRIITDTFNVADGRTFTSPLNGLIITIPGVTVNVIHNHCDFILTAPARSIVLPCPLWGDQQTFLGSVTIKRMTNGDTYTYIKQTDLRKLQYVFSIDTYKRLELYDFVKNFSADYITIANHKGETWKAQLVNNPFQFDSRSRYAPRREKFDVTLEFEGVRIA